MGNVQKTVKIPSIWVWIKGAQEWRILNTRKALIQEFRILECGYMKRLVRRLGLKKDKNNIITMIIRNEE